MSGKRVLVIDDYADNLELMKIVLGLEGHIVETAADSASALRKLRESRPDLILMDIQMPGMDGLELTRRIRADPALKTIRIVALTACAMNDDQSRILGTGCDGYIAKPVNTRTLAAALQPYLSGRPMRGHRKLRSTDDPQARRTMLRRG